MVLQNLDIYSINIHISKLTLYRYNHTALYKFIALETCVLMDKLFAIRINFIYSKIPIINPRASFWSKGLFTIFFLGGGGGGGAYLWTNICILQTLFFCSSSCNFLRFSAYNLSLLLILFLLLCFEYNPKGLIFRGGLIHGKTFPFSKLVPKCPGTYTRWSLLSEFYGIS